MILLENKKQFDLYAQKLKDDIKLKFDNIKNKFNYIEKGLDGKAQIAKENNKIIKDKYKKELDKLKAEILVLRSDNNKLIHENNDLKNTIQQLKDNEQFFHSIENPNINLNPFNTFSKSWKNSLNPSRVMNFELIPNRINTYSMPNKYINNTNNF